MMAVFAKEFYGFLNSLIAYVVMGVFLTATGLLMWVFPDTSVMEYGYADMDTLFSMGPYVFIFLVPAITMKSFAEEKKMGTLELIMTKPLGDWSLLMGKFLAAFALVFFALLPTLVYYFSLRQLGNPVNNIDTPGVMGSYVGLLLLGGVFCAIGVLASALTANQIVAFILAAFLCFLFYAGFESLAGLIQEGTFSLRVQQVGILYHYEAMSKGLIDSRDLIYFVTMGTAFLAGAKTVLSSRTW